MLEGIIEFWNALKPKVEQTVSEKTGNCLRVERFDVVAAPSDGKISVRQPYGRTISIPYTEAVSTAKAVEWSRRYKRFAPCPENRLIQPRSSLCEL